MDAVSLGFTRKTSAVLSKDCLLHVTLLTLLHSNENRASKILGSLQEAKGNPKIRPSALGVATVTDGRGLDLEILENDLIYFILQMLSSEKASRDSQ